MLISPVGFTMGVLLGTVFFASLFSSWMMLFRTGNIETRRYKGFLNRVLESSLEAFFSMAKSPEAERLMKARQSITAMDLVKRFFRIAASLKVIGSPCGMREY